MNYRSNVLLENGCRICTWNANGLANKTEELGIFLHEHDVHFLLVSETHAANGQGLFVPGYRFHATPRANGRGGGTAIYVKMGIDFSPLDNPPTQALESSSIITEMNGERITLSAIYQSPSRRFVEDDYEALFARDGPVILGGDFNAKHLHWNSRIQNNRGRKLFEYINNHNVFSLSVASQTEPTFYHGAGHRPDIIDFYVVKDLHLDTESFTVAEMDSDHQPVFLDVHTTISRMRRSILKTDWRKFTDSLRENLPPTTDCTNPVQIGNSVSAFTTALKEALEAATEELPVPTSDPLNISRDLLQAIREKNRVRREWQRTRCPHVKRHLNSLQREIQSEIREIKDARWERRIEEAAESIPKLWKITK